MKENAKPWVLANALKINFSLSVILNNCVKKYSLVAGEIVHQVAYLASDQPRFDPWLPI